MDWTSYRYAFDNPIRLVDPNGMFESLYEYPPEDYQGISWCDSDGCFNRSSNTGAYRWTDHEGKFIGIYSDRIPVITAERSLLSKFAIILENIIGRVSGTAFESQYGRFNSAEFENVEYGDNIDGLINSAEFMKSVQGASWPLGNIENNADGVKQMSEFIDWGANAGNVLYNVLPSYGKKDLSNPNPWGPEGGNDTFHAIFGYQLHNPKHSGLIVRFDSGGIIVPYNPVLKIK